VAGSDQLFKVEATGLITYLDVVVYCRPWRFDPRSTRTLLTPALIVEVLSPSTLNYDKGAKFDNYKQIPTLRDYLLVAQNKVEVAHYHRLDNGDWQLHTATGLETVIQLEALNCTLALADIYATIEPDDMPYSLHQAE
jgi:Uma2 family endonuclease